jgi:hypothetical protein
MHELPPCRVKAVNAKVAISNVYSHVAKRSRYVPVRIVSVKVKIERSIGVVIMKIIVVGTVAGRNRVRKPFPVPMWIEYCHEVFIRGGTVSNPSSIHKGRSYRRERHIQVKMSSIEVGRRVLHLTRCVVCEQNSRAPQPQHWLR